MIGFIKGEESIILQCWPIYGSEKGIPKWAQFHINYSPKRYGEYGVAWSFHKGHIPTMWIAAGLTTYSRITPFLRDLFKGRL